MENSYFKILYRDFSTKIKSVNKYLEKVKSETGDINQSVFEWAGKLHDKFEALETFQQTRPHSTSPGNFAIENQGQSAPTSSDVDLKKIESGINDSSEQINYLFQKTEKELQFMVQTFQELQNLVNSIYDKYQELYDDM